MNLRQIEVFRAVMLAGSVTGAAKLLHVSQPGVSRMLAHTELQLGVRLFEHVRGRLRPTPEAQTLYAQVEQVYRGVSRLEDCARDLKTGGGLSLRVLASPSVALEIVPRAIADTSARFPGAMIYMETQFVREIVAQLAAGEADVAIASLPVEHALLESIPVGSWSLACVFRAGHPFSARRSVLPRDILKERLIAFSADTPQARVIAEWCATHDLAPDTRIEVRSGQAACALAACGAGVAVVDNLTARAWRSPDIAFRPVSRGPTFSVHAVRHASAAQSLLAQTFVERVGAEFQALRQPRRD